MERVIFLKNKEPYGSLELAKQALNAYAQANSLLDGEPIIGRYYDDGTVKAVLGVCTVTETSPSGCVTGEKLTFFIDEDSIDSLRLENLTDVDVLSKLEGDVLYYDGVKWTNMSGAVFDGSYVHTDNNYTNAEKSKLANIQAGAEVNVQADWNQTNVSSDAYIRNKPTNVSQFSNDAGYLVASDVDGKADKVQNARNGNVAGLDSNGNLTDTGISGMDVSETVGKAHTHANKAVLDATTASFTVQEQDKLSGIEDGAEVNVQSDWGVTDTSSDAYIKNKPKIPTSLSDLSDDANHRLVTDTNIQNWNGKYTKPNGGIPKTDLDTSVQASLDKADTSVQPSDISDMQVKSNLRTSFQTTPDNTHYPSEKLVKDSLDAKEPTLQTQTAYSQKGTSTKVPQITTNTKGQVTGITEVDISFPSGSGSVTGNSTTFVKEVNLSGHTLSGTTQIADSQITDAASGIPTTAAVREFVNSSVSNMAANYITKNANGDAFDSNSELIGASTYYSGGLVFTPTKNDYAIVLKDETQAEEIPGYSSFTDDDEYIGFYILVGSTYTLVTDSNVSSLGIVAGTTKAYELPTTRYVNSSTTITPSWSFQYIINDTGLTAAQIAAINSGINATKVGNYETHISDTTIHVTASDKSNWNNKLDPVTAVTHDSTKNYVKQVTQSTNGQVSIVEGVLDYNDLANVPTIPSAPGTLITNATNGQTASSGESMSGTITLHKVSKTGSYNDLLNKPTIPTVPTDVSAFNNDAGYITMGDVPAQVNADWNSNSGVSQILNKPTIPAAPGTLNTTATTAQSISSSEALSGNVTLHKIAKTGTYNDLIGKPTIPVITGKADKVSGATNGNLAGLDSSGNITDSGVPKGILDKIPTSIGTTGQAIVVNSAGTGLEFGSVSSTLEGLTDTNITSPTDGQALIYDSNSSKWINGAGGGGDTVTGKTVTLGATGVAVIQVNGVDAGSVSLPSSSTSGAGIVQLTNSTSSTSTTTAATPNSVKSAYDLAAGAIPKSTGTTGGDIIYFTSANTPTRLAKGTAGQVLTMNSGATAPEWQTPSGGGLTNYNFTHVANTTVTSPFTFTCTANQRNSQMITTGANLTLNIACNNGSDNYLWIINSSSSVDIDVVIGTVAYNGTALSASSIYLPSDGITVPKSGLCEIGIIMNSDGCIISSRNDLVPSV